jgi:hypothetical protein
MKIQGRGRKDNRSYTMLRIMVHVYVMQCKISKVRSQSDSDSDSESGKYDWCQTFYGRKQLKAKVLPFEHGGDTGYCNSIVYATVTKGRRATRFL